MRRLHRARGLTNAPAHALFRAAVKVVFSMDFVAGFTSSGGLDDDVPAVDQAITQAEY